MKTLKQHFLEHQLNLGQKQKDAIQEWLEQKRQEKPKNYDWICEYQDAFKAAIDELLKELTF